jgi:hypothetical protein
LRVNDENASVEAIELRVNNIGQLFHSLDPFPFREKDLDKEVEEYIVSWARELDNEQPIEIIIYLPEKELHTKAASELAEAFARYELNDLYRVGRRFLAIGMTVLVACLVLSQVAVRVSRFWVGSRIGVRLRSSFMSGGHSHAAAIYIVGYRPRL